MTSPALETRSLLTMVEAAEYLCRNRDFMRRQVAQKKITYYRVGRLVMFERSDLDAFLTSSRTEATS